jgi:hypothetical protein
MVFYVYSVFDNSPKSQIDLAFHICFVVKMSNHQELTRFSVAREGY